MLDPDFFDTIDSDTPILSERKAILWRNVGTGGARVYSIRLFKRFCNAFATVVCRHPQAQIDQTRIKTLVEVYQAYLTP